MNALPLYFFDGQRAGSIVYHGGDGYFYHKSNSRPNKRFDYFRCIHRDSVKNCCSGSAKSPRSSNVLYHLHIHGHPANTWYPLVCALKADIIRRVKAGDQASFREMIQQEGQRYPIEARAQVASGSFEARLYAIRSKMRPPIPRSIGVLGACLTLPEYEYLTRCPHEEESIFAGMCGSLADGTFSLLFITPEMRAFMETRSMIFADGTERRLFRKPKASQIFVFSTVWRYHVITMGRAVMQRKTERAYLVLFTYLKTLVPNFRPQSIKCDFEDAQMNAWRIAFPLSSVEGCLWHFDVAVWSMARRKLGLCQLVKDEEDVASIVRSAGALPLLPTHDIEAGLEDLGWEARERGWMRQLRPFLQYMEKEWMPKVPVLSVKDSSHRTNNAAESSNRTLNKEIKVSNPSCYNVLRAFVATNEKAMVDMRTLAAGRAPGRVRRVSALRNDVRIRRLTMDYENGDITRLQFLHRASRRMQNVFNKVFR